MVRLKIFGIVIFIIVLICILWWSNGLKPVNSSDNNSKEFSIVQGETLREIAKRLKEQKLIRDQIVFFLEVKINGLDKKIQAGEFELSPNMSVSTIIEKLGHGTFDEWVSIPEGWRNEEIADELSKTFNISKNEFLKYAKIGYMFPSKYRIPRNASAETIAKQMRDTFDLQWQKINFSENRSREYLKNITEDQIVIFASVVEKEAKKSEDFPLIAGILLKRYQSQMPLEVDATVQYALGYNEKGKTWWKKDLTQEDLSIESPYNTRKYINLPPTPISNPGEKALLAVMNYKDSPYWFYLADDSGVTYYGKTLEEHNQNIRKYLSD